MKEILWLFKDIYVLYYSTQFLRFRLGLMSPTGNTCVAIECESFSGCCWPKGSAESMWLPSIAFFWPPDSISRTSGTECPTLGLKIPTSIGSQRAQVKGKDSSQQPMGDWRWFPSLHYRLLRYPLGTSSSDLFSKQRLVDWFLMGWQSKDLLRD